MISDRPPPPAPPAQTLLERLLGELRAEGGRLSRRQAQAWIRAGAVRVEGRVRRSPDDPVERAERLSFDPEQADRGARAGPARPGARAAAAPPWLLHADAWLVAVERGAFAPNLGGEALARAVSGALEAAGLARGRAPRGRLAGLVAVPDASGAGSGVALLCASAALAARVSEAEARGALLESLLALRAGPPLGSGERWADAPPPAPQGAGFALREERPPGPPPPGARDLVPPHRLLLTLRHPKSNRRMTLACEPTPAFLDACARALGASGRRAVPGPG